MQTTHNFFKQFDEQKFYVWTLYENGTRRWSYSPTKNELINAEDSKQFLVKSLDGMAPGAYTISLKKTIQSSGNDLTLEILNKEEQLNLSQKDALKNRGVGSVTSQGNQPTGISFEKYEAQMIENTALKIRINDLENTVKSLTAENETLANAEPEAAEPLRGIDGLIDTNKELIGQVIKHIFMPAAPMAQVGALGTPKKKVPITPPVEEEEDETNFSWSEEIIIKELGKKVMELEVLFEDEDPFDVLNAAIELCKTLCKILPNANPTEILEKLSSLAVKNPQMMPQILSMS